MHPVAEIKTPCGYTIKGVSVAGIYTTLVIPELKLGFDCGIALREFAGIKHLFLSHAHGDHIGGLVALLGQRDLMSMQPLNVYVPDAIVHDVREYVRVACVLMRSIREVDAIRILGLAPGDAINLGHGVSVHAFSTHHPVPSLGYQIRRVVSKLKPELVGIPGEEIGRRRKAGEAVTNDTEVNELSFITDTSRLVYSTMPSVLESRVLIAESTYVCDKYDRMATQRHGHMHLLDTIEQNGTNELTVLTHFSQMYEVDEVKAAVASCGRDNVVPLVPEAATWW